MLKERAKDFLTTLWTCDVPDTAAELVTSDFTLHLSGSQDTQDFTWYLALVKHFRSGIHELDIFFHQFLREGPNVAGYYTFVGRHHSRVFGVDAQDNFGQQEAMSIFTFNNGRIQQQISVTDFMSLKRQMVSKERTLDSL